MKRYGMAAVLALLTGWQVSGAVGAGFDAHTSRLDPGTYRSSQYSFEEEGEMRPFAARNGRLSLSPDHFKHGQKSLRWDFSRRGELVLTDPEGMALLSERVGGLKMWLYAEKPLSGTLRSFCSRSSISLCLKRSIFPKDSLQPSYRLAWFSRSMIT